MQYTTLALAFAATAFAQTDLDDIVSVLVTALPSSLISAYETNSAAVASEIESEFSAGNTPSWFAALPSDVQTFLIPATETASATLISSPVSGAPTIIGMGNSTLATTRRTPSVTSTTSSSDSENTGSSSDESGSGSDSSSSSSGGASLPTAVVGMGLAGAAGLVGLLAL